MAASVWFFFSLALLGALHVSAVSIRLLASLALCLRRPKDLRHRYGAWAVVTGPTSGIGRSMSLELARRGLNLVLVGRDPAKLRDISETISGAHAVQTKTVLFDFSLVSAAQGDEAMRRLREAVAGLDVGLLVNNAGVAKPGAMYLHEADVEAWARMIRVNVLALTEVTAAVLPGMVRRGRGAVVNLGSGSASVLPSFPLYSVYAATKRYVAEFSRSLAVEYGSSGIDVQCQVPFLVETNMVSSAVKANLILQFVLTPDAYAYAAVRWIGHGRLCVPNVAHRFQGWYAGLFPDFVNDAFRLEKNRGQRAILRRVKPWRKSQSQGHSRVPIQDKGGVGVRSE
ncbi:very-long-chain 3-oxoacyl-CoA reductase 1-like [Hordeum vulgare subsp. vulgare]|uniref:B-keto acyl reductase n=1 Tax=Hordeum vulgare subsp. vulgare TaxID=112509 RepID=A0A8I6YUE3_HORVV|nr:very-long-chain 3-oxoacyl-CoA reductase 1-like [Hordeum vulgare subsp. vulgare]